MRSSPLPRPLRHLWAILLWLLLWQLLSAQLGAALLLPSPIVVAKQLFSLSLTIGFWQSILFSLLRIATGFFLGLFVGLVLAGLATHFGALRDFLVPAMVLLKASPVASFTILLLIWVPSQNLSVVIAFMMVLPIIYTNLLAGFSATDPQLLEMADLFGISTFDRLRSIYLSQLLPFLRSGCAISLGLCWKAGVAAEVIGIPQGSIGERLYEAKIYLNTPDLFAWTLVIVLLSLLFSRLLLTALDTLVQKVERM